MNHFLTNGHQFRKQGKFSTAFNRYRKTVNKRGGSTEERAVANYMLAYLQVGTRSNELAALGPDLRYPHYDAHYRAGTHIEHIEEDFDPGCYGLPAFVADDLLAIGLAHPDAAEAILNNRSLANQLSRQQLRRLTLLMAEEGMYSGAQHDLAAMGVEHAFGYDNTVQMARS